MESVDNQIIGLAAIAGLKNKGNHNGRSGVENK